MLDRDKIDRIAWQTIHSRLPRPLESARGLRAMDYRFLDEKLRVGVDFEHAWSDFLHAFFDFRTASFFTYPSPLSLSPQWQAVLAGAAEWLSGEFGLPHPAWTDEAKYFLAVPWDPSEDLGLDMSEFIADRLARSPEAFRKRNIAFLSRNLISL
jgi:hypothetical protein